MDTHPPPWMAPLVSSLGTLDSPPTEAGQWRPVLAIKDYFGTAQPRHRSHGRAAPWAARGRAVWLVFAPSQDKFQQAPPLPPPHAAISLTRLARPCLAALTCCRRRPCPSTIGDQVQNESGHKPHCCTPHAQIPWPRRCWWIGWWIGDLKEPARGEGKRHHCRFLLSTPLCPLQRSPSRVPLFSIPILILILTSSTYFHSPRQLPCVSGSWKHRVGS